ncbi:putative colanic acid biosynthesis acetyltransferase, partial [Vogesella mureinivorans]|uniref:putative colanic acid biosynthesis acetyltransferase n=1 Tax=Vogesella mureinivorans TaxID=657276 RepID=UPI0011CB7DE4
NLAMGPFSLMGPGVNCYCVAPIVIGAQAVVSQGAHLCAGSHDYNDPHFQLTASPIAIGEKAWIAAEAFVGPGVVVETGAVLGARGVAVKPLASWTVHAGNPARPVGRRT